MVLGLSKSFVIFNIIAIIFAIGMEDKIAYVWIMGTYIVIKIAWKFLTHKR